MSKSKNQYYECSCCFNKTKKSDYVLAPQQNRPTKLENCHLTVICNRCAEEMADLDIDRVEKFRNSKHWDRYTNAIISGVYDELEKGQDDE